MIDSLVSRITATSVGSRDVDAVATRRADVFLEATLVTLSDIDAKRQNRSPVAEALVRMEAHLNNLSEFVDVLVLRSRNRGMQVSDKASSVEKLR